MSCPNITRVWFGSHLNIRFKEFSECNFEDWLFDFISNNEEQDIIQTTAIIYSIWHARNLCVFEYNMLPEEEILQRAYRSIHEFHHATKPPSDSSSNLNPTSAISLNRSQPPSRATNRNVSWIKPEPAFVKANYDASMKIKGVWGIGAIIRNEEGLVMASTTWRISGFADTTTAEACALWKTMILAKECGFRHIIFEGDSERVTRMVLNKERQERNYLSLFIQEIQCIQSSFDKCTFRFTPRSGNRAADSLAHLAHTDPDMVWMEELPPAIYDVYFHDLIS